MDDQTVANGMLAAALRYAELGWSIIPTTPGTKKAARSWKLFQDTRADESQLRKWFSNGAGYGMAVILGKVSGGLVCRDFDDPEAFTRWKEGHPDYAAALPTVATARGGHVYFRAEEDDLRFVNLADGEYRGDSGHYCLLPPSRHPSGSMYRWLVPLPDREVPLVTDVRAAGLLHSFVDVDTETHNNSIAVCSEGSTYTESATSSVSPVSTLPSESAACLCVTSTENKIITSDIETLIRGALPSGPGHRNRQVFELARVIKAVPALADANPDDLRHIVKRWHTLALPKILTREFTETWIDFLQAWPKVKSPKGVKMAAIMEKALQSPMPKAAERYEIEEMRRLVSLCRQLDREAKGGTFFLSCRTAAELLGVSHTQANRWLFLLDHDKVVKQINKGDRAKRQAAEYRYLGKRE